MTPQKISTKSSYSKKYILKFKILNPLKWPEPTYVWKSQSIPTHTHTHTRPLGSRGPIVSRGWSGSNCFSMVVVTSIYKKTYRNLWFSRGVRTHCPSSGSARGYVLVSLPLMQWVGLRSVFLADPRPRGYKTFCAQLNWAWNFNFS